MNSNCQAINEPDYETWADYRRGCLLTFHGGLDGQALANFQHGITTVFNLLEAEFPQPKDIRLAQRRTTNTTLGSLYLCREAICGLVDAIDYGKANRAVRKIDEAIKSIVAQTTEEGAGTAINK
jgi:hypothetical protein